MKIKTGELGDYFIIVVEDQGITTLFHFDESSGQELLLNLTRFLQHRRPGNFGSALKLGVL